MTKKTIRGFVVSLVFFCVSLGGFIYMITEVNDKGVLLKEQVSALFKKQAQEESFYKLKRVEEESREQRAELDSFFFKKESDSIDFLNSIEALAPQVGVSLKTESLKQTAGSVAGESWVEAAFSLNGTYGDVMRFVTLLENLPYVSEMTRLDIGARTKDNWEAQTTMKVKVYDYDKK